MPHLTPLRCAACTITGGTVVQSGLDVAEVNSTPLVKLAIHEGRRSAFRVGDGSADLDDETWGDVRACVPGDRVVLRPCLKREELADIQREHGRPCPLVQLDGRNHIAAPVLFMSMNGDPLVTSYVDATHADRSARERADTIQRVLYARASHPVKVAQERRAKEREEAAATARKRGRS